MDYMESLKDHFFFVCLHDMIPFAKNLALRGVILPSADCPFFLADIEDITHLFFE